MKLAPASRSQNKICIFIFLTSLLLGCSLDPKLADLKTTIVVSDRAFPTSRAFNLGTYHCCKFNLDDKYLPMQAIAKSNNKGEVTTSLSSSLVSGKTYTVQLFCARINSLNNNDAQATDSQCAQAEGESGGLGQVGSPFQGSGKSFVFDPNQTYEFTPDL